MVPGGGRGRRRSGGSVRTVVFYPDVLEQRQNLFFEIHFDAVHEPAAEKSMRKGDPEHVLSLINIHGERIEPAGEFPVRKKFLKMLSQSMFKHCIRPLEVGKTGEKKICAR